MTNKTPQANSTGAFKNDPYVREAYPKELRAAAHVASLAFANDPVINWFGSSKVPINLKLPLNKHQEKYMRILFYFFDSLTRSVHFIGGRITVVVIPNESTGVEEIAAVGHWVPPGKLRELDSLLTIVRSKQIRTIFGTWKHFGGWGLTALNRAAFKFQPALAKYYKKWSSESSINTDDCWRLEAVATHPDLEGRGYCSMIVREGIDILSRSNSSTETAICIEATTSKSRQIYQHLGFEDIGELVFGSGKVSRSGRPSDKKDENVGILVILQVYLPKKDTLQVAADT